MKEIGGYFELDPGAAHTPLPDGVLLNSGRNALRHIVRQLRIGSMWVPDYTCPVVWEALKAESCKLRFYRIGLDMLPKESLPRDDFILYVNYFGCCGRNVERLAAEFPNLIVDCAQAYHARPRGRASFYSPRKFFGVADGGVACGVEGGAYERDDSLVRLRHLTVRKEQGATAGYALFRAAEASLDGAPVREMSAQTRSALERVDAAAAIERRRANFAFLRERIHSDVFWPLAEDDVPMVCPYVTDDASVRSRLIASGIYVARYWPGLLSEAGELAERIVPLPIDQRYDFMDMKRILEVLNG